MQRKPSNIAGSMIHFSIVVFDLYYYTILIWKFADMEKLSTWKNCPQRIFWSLLIQKWRVQWFSCQPQHSHRLVLTPTITFNLPTAPATAVLLHATQTQWQWTKPTHSNFFCAPRQDLQFLFYSFVAVSLRQLIFLT